MLIIICNQIHSINSTILELINFQNTLWVQAVLDSTTTENWKNTGQITCDCPVFMKKYYCKHTLSLAVRLNYTKFPLCARDEKIGPKPKISLWSSTIS